MQAKISQSYSSDRPLDLHPAKPWGVWAMRSASSMFGAAESWAKKRDGQPMQFATEAEAETEAARLTGLITSANVHYAARRIA